MRSDRLTRRGEGRQSAGFTLIELIITVAIAAILLALAVPSFQDTIRNNRLVTAANNMMAGLNTGRSEALRRGRMVSLCPSANGTSCGTDWSLGWMVYVEKTTVVPGGNPDVDAVLQVGQAARGTVLTRTAGTKNYIRFTSRGLPEEAFTLQVQPTTCTTGYAVYNVNVGAAGRPSVSKSACP